MKPQGSFVVIICSLLVQLTAILTTKSLSNGEPLLSSRVAILCFQGLMFLVYPLLGHLADVYLIRYRTLKCGIIAIVVSSLLLFVIELTSTLQSNVFYTQNNLLKKVITAPGIITAIVGLGLLETNAIQFGLDQLLEAPTPKLISFIHWYYWSQNVAGLVMYYLVGGGFVAVHKNLKTKLYWMKYFKYHELH